MRSKRPPVSARDVIQHDSVKTMATPAAATDDDDEANILENDANDAEPPSKPSRLEVVRCSQRGIQAAGIYWELAQVADSLWQAGTHIPDGRPPPAAAEGLV